MSGHDFMQTNLVSDQPGVAAVTDPNLVNAWGHIPSATGPWWISDNATGLSTLYAGTGAITPLVVSIPAPAGAVSNGLGRAGRIRTGDLLLPNYEPCLPGTGRPHSSWRRSSCSP